MPKIRDILETEYGHKYEPKITNKVEALKVLLDLEKIGIVFCRGHDGVPIDPRFLRHEKRLVEITKEAVAVVLDTEVRNV